MRDVRGDLTHIWRTLSRLNAASDTARAVMFIAARDGEGTTSIAASFAVLAAAHVRRAAWLIDLDLRRNPAFAGFEAGFADDVGTPARAYDASLGQPPFYQVSPDGKTAADPRLLTLNAIDGKRLLVSRFRSERLAPGQALDVRTSPAWWQAARGACDWLVVDAPSLARSPAGLAMASQVDAVVLVVAADSTTPQEVAEARREIEAHGGRIAGSVLTRMRRDAMAMS